MKRPNEKDFFEYRGKQRIIDYGSADNYIDALEEYIDFLEGKHQCKYIRKLGESCTANNNCKYPDCP